MASDRPVFVMGCPRSGTTLVTLMLHAHSRIAMPPETRFLLDVYRRRGEFGDLTVRANRRRLAKAIVRNRGNRFLHLGLERLPVRKAIVRGAPTVGSALGTVFRSYAARFGKPRWGDKLPTYFRNVEAIRAMFPDAQFVHVVRDGRDCVASLKTMTWWQRRADSVDAMALWVHSVDCVRRAAKSLPSDALWELRYEDLVVDPERELRALCDFLGEEFEEDMLTPRRVVEQSLPTREREGWHANTLNDVSASRVGGHREVLDPWELRLMERVAGSRMRRLGYDVVPAQGRPPFWQWLRYAVKLTSLRIRTRVLAHKDRKVARPPGSMADRGRRVRAAKKAQAPRAT